MRWYVFNTKQTIGTLCTVRYEWMAQAIAMIMTAFTGRLYDYWHTPEGI